MSPSFSDGERLKQKAKQSLHDSEGQVRRWWSERFKLPPNHKLFTSVSIAEHMLEMYEDLMFRREDVRNSLEDRSGDQKVLMEQLALLNRALGEDVEHDDDLFDQWERDLEEGRVPDLNAETGSH